MKKIILAALLLVMAVTTFANPPVWTYQTHEDHTDPEMHCIILVTKTWGVDWLGQVTLMSTSYDYSGCNSCGCN